MTAELVPVTTYKFRSNVPEDWRKTIDTRLYWMWHQRLGTIQMIREKTTDVLDRTAAELVMQAVYGDDLSSLLLLIRRLEGGPMGDRERQRNGEDEPLRV